MHNLSKKAKIGAFGHELAHIFDYIDKSTFNIIIFGIKYLNNNLKENIEKKTDRIAIKHNISIYILQWAKEVYPIKKNDGNRGVIYYSPTEIESIITKQKNNE